jgi:hypothetical protein
VAAAQLTEPDHDHAPGSSDAARSSRRLLRTLPNGDVPTLELIVFPKPDDVPDNDWVDVRVAMRLIHVTRGLDPHPEGVRLGGFGPLDEPSTKALPATCVHLLKQ